MRLLAKDFEIRGCEVKESQKTGNKYIVVRVEDETGQRGELIDRAIDNAPYYTRGTIADMVLEYQTGKYTSLSVVQLRVKADN